MLLERKPVQCLSNVVTLQRLHLQITKIIGLLGSATMGTRRVFHYDPVYTVPVQFSIRNITQVSRIFFPFTQFSLLESVKYETWG